VRHVSRFLVFISLFLTQLFNLLSEGWVKKSGEKQESKNRLLQFINTRTMLRDWFLDYCVTLL